MENVNAHMIIPIRLGSVLINAKTFLLLALESVHINGNSIVPIFVSTSLQVICATMSVSLKKHHAKAPVQVGRYFVMENARTGLCNVTVNVWINIFTSLLIVMERVKGMKKIGSAILYVSQVKNLVTGNALKVILTPKTILKL